MQEKLENYLKRKVREGVFPGCSYYIYCEGEEYIGCVGNKSLLPNKEKNTIDTLYDIASLSKLLVTNLLVSLLLQDNKIKLDDKVKTYLPKFKYDNVLILHLLTHSSGIKVLYDKNNISINNMIIPLIISFLLLLYLTPKALVARIPPISPPICPKLSIPVTENPYTKLTNIKGII